MDEASVGFVLAAEPTSAVVDFWDLYEEFGMVYAVDFINVHTNNDLGELKAIVPPIMEEAKKRGVDMVQFIKEWDEHMEGKDSNLPGEEKQDDTEACTIS